MSAITPCSEQRQQGTGVGAFFQVWGAMPLTLTGRTLDEEVDLLDGHRPAPYRLAPGSHRSLGGGQNRYRGNHLLELLGRQGGNNSVKLAVEEINAKGGVKVGGKMLPFAVESIDIRDAAPGVPVPEALLGMEKLILEKKPHA